MKASQTFAATMLLAVASNVFSTVGVSASIGRYSFDYAISGEGRARPVQVFDNGEKTFFQFRQGADIPAFFSVDGTRHFVPTQEGPYIVIAGVPRDIVTRMGLSSTRITHASLVTNAVQTTPDGRAVLPTPAPVQTQGVQLASAAPVAISSLMPSQASVPNAWTDNSYAQPRRGDHVVWTGGAAAKEQEGAVHFPRGESRLTATGNAAIAGMAATLARAAKVTVVGRDDDSFKEGLGEARAKALKAALVRAGVPAALITERSAAPVEGGTIKKGSVTLVPSLIRWSDTVAVEARSMPARAPSTAQAEVAQRLATGAITPSQAIDQLRRLAPESVAPAASSGAQTPAPAAPSKWAVRASDKTLEAMLSRWASSAGWRVVSKGAPEIQINGDAEFERPDFIQAAEFAIAQAAAAGHRIEASAYSNKVLVIKTKE